MTWISFRNTQRLAVRVRPPTGCGPVLPRCSLRPQIRASHSLGEPSACLLNLVSASELLPNHRRKQFRIINRRVVLAYFP